MPTVAGQTPAAYVAELRETWSRAAERTGRVSSRRYDVGGAPVRVLGAGPGLVGRLTRAVEHLPEGPGGTGLDVFVWDDATAGTATPPVPWLAGAGPAGAFRGSSGDVFLWTEEGRVDALDGRRGEAFLWLDSPERLPWYDEAAPLRRILGRWTVGRGLRVLHAGAVGRRDGCLLLIGRGGAGKSTTALACLGSELGYLADDFCLARADEPTAFSLYSSAKMSEQTLAMLPHLGPAATYPGPPGEKAVAYLQEHAPESLLARAPVRGVVLPRIVGGGAPSLVPVGRGAALTALTPNSLDEDPHLREDGFRLLAALAAAVPCHVLELGSDLAAVPPLLAGLLDG